MEFNAKTMRELSDSFKPKAVSEYLQNLIKAAAEDGRTYVRILEDGLLASYTELGVPRSKLHLYLNTDTKGLQERGFSVDRNYECGEIIYLVEW